VALGGGQGSAKDAQVRQIVTEVQQSSEWGSEAQQKLDALGADAAPELVRLIPKIERGYALQLVGQKLFRLGAEASIAELIKTLSRRYPGSPAGTHPAFEPLKSWSWKAVGPLVAAMDQKDFSTQYFAARLLEERCRFAPEDARLLPVMLRLTRSRIPDLEVIGESGLNYLAFYIEGGWMGETPVVYHIENRNALMGTIDLALSGTFDGRKAASTDLLRFVQNQKIEGPAPERGKLGEEDYSILIASRDAYLQNSVPEIRMACLALLARYEKTGMPHVAGLGDDEEAVRQVALRALAQKFDPAWAPEVAKHLKATSAGVRAAAAKALGLSFQPSAVAALRGAMKDENAGVRAAAQEAIRRIEGREFGGSGELFLTGVIYPSYDGDASTLRALRHHTELSQYAFAKTTRCLLGLPE
jgi:hypothetical protein